MMFRKRVSYTWRVLRAGFCFSIFGIGALSLFFAVFPLINFLTKRKNDHIRKVIHLSWRFFVFSMSALELISIKIINFEDLKESRGKIIIANHPSLIDVVILISLIPQADCIVKSSLANNFFMKGIIKSAYVINSINIDELLLSCLESLKKGNNLIIFPEGTRTVPGQKSNISRGAAQIAIHSQSDILPIKISCNPPALLKGQKWYHVADRKLEFTLEIKPAITIDKYLDESQERSIRARILNEEIKRILY